MASEFEKEVFGSEAATSLVKELRGTFTSEKTKSYEWRVSQLKSLLKLTNDHEKEITNALRPDLSKPVFESYVYEAWKERNKKLYKNTFQDAKTIIEEIVTTITSRLCLAKGIKHTHKLTSGFSKNGTYQTPHSGKEGGKVVKKAGAVRTCRVSIGRISIGERSIKD
ncbi:hypothetical protein TEA_008379 [Camellia sinensis var. sinensis]|uniref:Aldehyde dehydrogenase domain-containing protein n=1 Tax=Camellia sinensis var. sinensis TaxID=542762 RepID=A0A4S4DS16_CAMSN|nr:hypothetical protein TEA_008379 [Camellia sinensis var. sinensis]